MKKKTRAYSQFPVQAEAVNLKKYINDCRDETILRIISYIL